jgi:hypothetical protein
MLLRDRGIGWQRPDFVTAADRFGSTGICDPNALIVRIRDHIGAGGRAGIVNREVVLLSCFDLNPEWRKIST